MGKVPQWLVVEYAEHRGDAVEAPGLERGRVSVAPDECGVFQAGVLQMEVESGGTESEIPEIPNETTASAAEIKEADRAESVREIPR
jgi:hypothetical protein